MKIIQDQGGARSGLQISLTHVFSISRKIFLEILFKEADFYTYYDNDVKTSTQSTHKSNQLLAK